MIVRRLDNNKIVVVELGYDSTQEQEFIELNEASGFMCIDSLPYSNAHPEYNNCKWENNQIVVDDVENEKQYIAKQVQEYKDYLTVTDFKMTADYDQDTTDVKILRQQARDFIRLNQVD
jgi:hypothetical protein